MPKTLNTIQKLHKAGKVISGIVYIASMVGAILCLVGLLGFGLGVGVIRFGGTAIHPLIEESMGVSIATVNCASIMGVILCIGEMVVSRLAKRYFANEVEAGTPFTAAGAKELRRLGVVALSVSFACSVLADIVKSIAAKMVAEPLGSIDMGNEFSMGIGVAFILFSLICKYGAELPQPAQDLRPQ